MRVWVFSLPNIDEGTLVANVVDGGFVASYVFIEVAEQYYLCASALLLGNELCGVLFEVISGIVVFPWFLLEGGRLLVIGCDSALIGWFSAYLVCRYDDD
jgi:hypothetical protein